MVYHILAFGMRFLDRLSLCILLDDDDITDPAERMIVYAVFGSSVGMIRKRIKRIESAAGGARVVDLWGANHFVFLSNQAEVLPEMRLFMGGPG